MSKHRYQFQYFKFSTHLKSSVKIFRPGRAQIFLASYDKKIKNLPQFFSEGKILSFFRGWKGERDFFLSKKRVCFIPPSPFFYPSIPPPTIIGEISWQYLGLPKNFPRPVRHVPHQPHQPARTGTPANQAQVKDWRRTAVTSQPCKSKHTLRRSLKIHSVTDLRVE